MAKITSNTDSPSWWQWFKRKMDTSLDFVITDVPEELSEEYLSTSKKMYSFKKIDGDSLIIRSEARGAPYGIGGFSLLIIVFWYILGPSDQFFHPPDIYIVSIPLFLFICAVIYGLTMPQKEIILDRENGLFTFPGPLWHEGYTIPFDEATVGWVGVGSSGGNVDMNLVVTYPDKKYRGTELTAHVRKYYEIWSFYVWYMDKNRPLPPGSAFDPYRQQDFERRKAEGFPAPLYESHVPTPEATPEQQAEREQYWQDGSNAFFGNI